MAREACGEVEGAGLQDLRARRRAIDIPSQIDTRTSKKNMKSTPTRTLRANHGCSVGHPPLPVTARARLKIAPTKKVAEMPPSSQVSNGGFCRFGLRVTAEEHHRRTVIVPV